MKSTPLFIYILASVVLMAILPSCNETTTVGSTLLESEDIELGFVDDLEITAKTISPGAIPTYFGSTIFRELSSSSSFLLGQLDDPIFGKSESIIHFELGLVVDNSVNFRNATLDSMIFVFEYGSTGFYGDTLWPHDIVIEELAESLEDSDTLYSDQEYMIRSSLMDVPAASLTEFVPRPNDSLTVISHISREETRLDPQIRMKMRSDLADRIFNDTINNDKVALLSEIVKGFVIKSVPRNGNSMFSLGFSGDAAVEVHYTTTDSIRSIGRYILNRVIHQNYVMDHSGAEVDNLLDMDITDGSPIYVQGMSGVVTEFDLSSLADTQGKLLNQVELRVFKNDIAGDDDRLFPPAERLMLTKARNGDFIDDINFGFDAFQNESGINFFFDGALMDSVAMEPDAYHMNLTTYAKAVQRGEEDGKVRLEVFQKISNPSRVVLHGPGHPTLAPQLRVTFTEE